MGCDIHGMVEIKAYDDWEYWQGIINLEFLGRYYYLFGLLGCDRGDENLYPSRGIPENISEFTKLILDEDEATYPPHSHTWITYDEFKEIIKRLGDTNFGKDWFVLYKMLNVLYVAYGDENVRLIIWFDN
jgi:hypothetical protein